jgi:hypothetical protein
MQTLGRLSWITDRPVTEASTCTTHNTHKKQTSMPLAGIEPAIPKNERPQSFVIDPAATEMEQKAIFWTEIQSCTCPRQEGI